MCLRTRTGCSGVGLRITTGITRQQRQEETDTAGPRIRAKVQQMMTPELKTLLIVAFLIAIVWNLGAGLFYMMNDKGGSKRTVNALTKRIALSVVLILLLVLAIKMGWVVPHGVGKNPGS